MQRIHNQHRQLGTRRKLRAQMPPAEAMLWKRLQRSQILGAKFRRQHGIGRFIVDFYCPELQLVIELDGESHHGEAAVVYDAARQEAISSLSITFLRFTNQQVYEALDGVVETIQVKIEELRQNRA